jgi:NAD(P)-dependent dehydrogenase (short-subunit alcohol dehydrogenase family)
MLKEAFVTGTSTGIGLAIARVLVERGVRVFGTVRRADDGERVRAELGSGFEPVLMDVTEPESIQRAKAHVSEQLAGRCLGGLVNNAGIAIGGPLLEQAAASFERHFQVNVMGPFRVTQAFGPLLGADRARSGARGRIVNISSVAGKLAAPFLGGYAASKHALEAMSTSLRRELMLYGIDVIVVAPGNVVTPIWDKAEASEERYADTPYASSLAKFSRYVLTRGRQGYPPERIGTVVLEALTAQKPRARYAVVPDTFSNWVVPRLMPSRWLDRAMAKNLGLSPNADDGG